MAKKRTQAILHLSASETTLLSLSSGKKISFSFTSDILQNQEIINPEALKARLKILKDKLDTGNGEIILVLSDDFLFSKSISASHPEDVKKEVSTFIGNVPFETQNKVYKTFSFGGNTLVIATNKNLFTAFQEVGKQLGWQICYVVPETIFALLGDGKNTNTFNLEDADKFLYENTNLIKKLNFAECASEKKKFPTMSKKVKIVLASIIAILLLAGLGTSYYFFFYAKNNTKETIQEQPKEDKQEQKVGLESLVPVESKETKETTASDTIIEEKAKITDKAEITISVLNGAGIAGLAGTTKNQLVELGFLAENIEVGNAEIAEATTLTYNNVDELLIEEISDTLKETYPTVETVINEDLSSYDIQITLGQIEAE